MLSYETTGTENEEEKWAIGLLPFYEEPQETKKDFLVSISIPLVHK